MYKLLTSLCEISKKPASTSNSGTLPSQTVTNPRQQINAITTRSGKALEEPSTPLIPTPIVSNPSKEPEQNPETSTEKVQNPNLANTAHVPSPGEEDLIFMEIPNPKAKKTINVEIQDLNSPNPNSNQSRLPYPERMKVRGHDKPSAQYSRKDKECRIKSSSPPHLEQSELEDYLENDSIPPGIDLTLPSTHEVLSSNPTFPTLTGEKHSYIRNQRLFPFLKKFEEFKEQERNVSSDVQINTIVMPIRITFDNPIDFNNHFSKPKDLKKDLPISFNSTKPPQYFTHPS
ncbi:hypothetical protein Tco_0001835 [Tanacetum coccineum]